MNNKYFGNANTRVTVNEYGTSFGKDVKGDKDLMPMAKSRLKSAEEQAALTESFNMFKESNKGVDMKRLEELKNQRLTEKVMTEGYASLKDELFKDIMRQVCIEAMLVDEEVVLENVKVITDMVDNEVDRFGGFNALKDLVARTHNNLLESMVDMINEQAKVVGDRVLSEANKDCATSKDLFKTTDDEMLKFHNAKKDVGIDDVAEFVKDRVLNVVQGEQQAQEEKGAVIDEIKEKLSNAKSDVPVEEALTDIFDNKGLEELTLFESLMRKSYKNLLESQSSAIFESADFCEDEDCDDEEFDLDDLDIDDSDDDDEDPINDEFKESTVGILVQEGLTIETAKIFLKHVNTINNALEEGDTETLQEATQDLAMELEELSEACGNKKKAKEMKEACRKIQKCTTDVVDASCAKGKAKALVEEEDGEYCTVCGQDPCVCELMREENEEKTSKEPAGKSESLEEDSDSMETLEEGVVEKIKGVFDIKAILAAKRDYTKDKKILTDIINSCKTAKELEVLRQDGSFDNMSSTVNSLQRAARRHPDKAAAINDYISWLKNDLPKIISDKEKELKSIKESMEGLEEGARLDNFRAKVQEFFEKQLSKNIAKQDFDAVRERFIKFIDACKNEGDVDYLLKDSKIAIHQLENAKKHYPEAADKIEKHIKWIKGDCVKLLNEKRKEVKKASTLEEGLMTRTMSDDKLKAKIASKKKALDEIINNPYYDSADKGAQLAVGAIKDELNKLKKELDRRSNKRKLTEAEEIALEELEVELTEKFGVTKVQDFIQNKIYKKIASMDMEKEQGKMLNAINKATQPKELEDFMKEIDQDIQDISKAKTRHPDQAAKLDAHAQWLRTKAKKLCGAKIKELKSQTIKESFDLRLDRVCDRLNEVVDRHDEALNLALESLNVNYDGNSVCAPMITAKDCNLSNLEMAYKVKVVCESLRSLSERCESDEDKKQLGVMIDKNLGYLAEARQLMGESSPYKSKLLVMAENYLANLNSANLLESSNVVLEEAAKVVEDVYKYVETHSVLEETSNDFMDVVMAEAIVQYTIMEAFSTMNLVTYNSEEIRKMAKKNIR